MQYAVKIDGQWLGDELEDIHWIKSTFEAKNVCDILRRQK